jgi:hypothetical protein
MKEQCNIAAIPLTQEQYAIVDIWNYEKLNEWEWCAQKHHTKYKETFYAIRGQYINGKHTTIRMHRQIMNFPKNLQIDHLDGNTLMNIENNLKKVTNRQNSQNRHSPKSSKYPGVYWNKEKQKWQSQITINGKHESLGRSDLEEEAYEKYCKKLEEIK